MHARRPPFKTVNPIQRVLYGAPLLSAQQMAFWEWVAAYYMCTPGGVMRVGLPSLMKPSGDTGKVNPMPFHPRDEQSIRDCIGNSDIVLNLVGKYYETKNIYLKKNYT